MGQKPVSDASGLLQRTIIKWLALYLPLRWRQGILTTPEIDQECDGTKPANFDSDVAELEELLVHMRSGSKNREWPQHPVFGPMSDSAWLRWGYLHTDHHLRQFGA